MSVDQTKCCGLQEFDGFDEFYFLYGTLKRIDEEFRNTRSRFLLFTDVQTNKDASSGVNLYTCIIKNKLGDVVKTKTKVNPNTGNLITCYVWELNRDKVAKFLTKQEKILEKKCRSIKCPDHDKCDDWCDCDECQCALCDYNNNN